MIRFILKIVRVPTRRKIRFVQVTLLLHLVHFSLRVLPFAGIYGVVKRFHRPPRGRTGKTPATEDICWAVNRAGELWFHDNACLAQALVGEALLLRAGVPARLVIGVRKAADGAFLAHAWVERSDQVVVIGGKTGMTQDQFQPFSAAGRLPR